MILFVNVAEVLLSTNLFEPPVARLISSVPKAIFVLVSPLWNISESIPTVLITDVPAGSTR